MKSALCLALVATLAGGVLADMTPAEKAALGANASRSFLSLGNGQVDVHVADADNYYAGRFTIGTADGRYLLYGHGSDPATSYPRVKVDGVVYGPGMGGQPDMAMLELASGPEIVGNSILTTWMAGGVRVIQRLTPTTVDGSGMVEIRYNLANTSDTAHEVSVLLEMDTMVNWNDAAPISTSNGYVASEICLGGADVPNSWQAFEVGPAQEPQYLTGCGILYGYGATRPDFAAFGRWGAMYSGAYDYICEDTSYGDSACLLGWTAGQMEDGDVVEYRTYYGTCNTISAPGELSLSLTGTPSLSCMGGQVVPDPLDINLLVTNTGADVCSGVTVLWEAGNGLLGGGTIEMGDLAAGATEQVSLQVDVAEDVCDVTADVVFIVTSQTCPTNSIGREFHIPCCNDVDAHEQALSFGLAANHPNPFNPATTLSFTMAETGAAKLVVHNLAGETVATLWNGPASRGEHEVVFNAGGLPSGMYLATLTTAQGSFTQKMLLAK